MPGFRHRGTWKSIDDYPIEEKVAIPHRKRVAVHGITFEAFPVEHSVRCPAVAYCITAGAATVVYAPDLVYIVERAAALAGIRLYIGDGASLTRPLVRRRGKRLIGHTPARTQLTWCQKEAVPRAIITHCGSQIVADHRAAARALNYQTPAAFAASWLASVRPTASLQQANCTLNPDPLTHAGT